MFTFDNRTFKSVDPGFADGWYTNASDRPAASVVGGMTVAQAYAYVSWVYGAVSKISEAVRSYPLGLYRGENDAWDDQALNSITKDLRENLAFIAECVLLAGAGYLRPYSKRADGRDVKLEPLPLLTVKPVNANNGDLTAFLYTYGGQVTRYAPEDLIYFWKKSLTKRNEPGVSAAMNALGPASQLFAIDSFIAAYFNRGAVPVTVWPVDPATPKEEQERFQSWLNRSASGVAQAFRNLVIRTRPDVKAMTIGSSVKDTLAPELVTIARDNVAVSFNMPPSILSGANGDESNQRADYAAFYQFCVTPLVQMLAQTMNEQFLTSLGLELWPEPEKLPVMAQAKLDQLKGVAEITPGQQILTRAEARELVGYATPEETNKDVTTLNGAQVTAALEVMRGMSAGEIAAGAALPIIMALGIDEKTANAMIAAQSAMVDEAEDDGEEAAPPPATTPNETAQEGQEDAEDEDMGEDDGESEIDAVKAALAQWRDDCLDYARSHVEKNGALGVVPIHKAPDSVPDNLKAAIIDDLVLSGVSSKTIRAVFERHWPRPKKVYSIKLGEEVEIQMPFSGAHTIAERVSDVARLAIALEEATKALRESETGV